MFKMFTKPGEFIKFHKALMSNAPQGYTPWYFPVTTHNKCPDAYAIGKRSKCGCSDKYSWKANHAQLSFQEALDRLVKGGNVGIAARQNDPLVIIDIDEFDCQKYLLPTLTDISRKRTGWHCFCWTNDDRCKVNIPTKYGEVRSSEQYVVAAGSYCNTSEKDIDSQNLPEDLKKQIKKDSLLGVYSCCNTTSPIKINFEDLPCFFKEKSENILTSNDKPIVKKKVIVSNGKKSALFDLKITDIVNTLPGKREPHPLHGSDTGMNFSIKDGLGHCWRHLVSLNAIQFLCVKSGYMSCEDAGTGHKGSGAGMSLVTNDDGAIFHAWCEAKKMGIIPLDDPIPFRAMLFIAKSNGLINPSYDKKLPKAVYNKVIKIVEQRY